jgi:putative methionine-R-sulfoxide reductase with GAF domain
VGELDIDSHGAGAFDDSDREFLEMVCQIIAPII